MSHPVVIKENMTVYDAICTIFLEDVSTLFITNENNDFVGVCSRKDLLRASMIGEDIHTMPISVNMTRMPNVSYLKEQELVIYAANQMIDKEIDSLPIVRPKENDKFEVIGRISKTTITKLFVSLFKRIGGKYMDNIKIIVASDSIGETAELVARAGFTIQS